MGGLILCTGATGFLGSRIARRIIEGTDYRLVVLVRGSDETDARRRLGRQWHGWFSDDLAASGRVRVVRGDLSLARLGMSPAVYADLSGSVTHIIHTAAQLRLDGNIRELRRVNVEGTAELLSFARRAHEDHGIERFSHVSTAYVAGRRTGEVAEEDLSDRYGFFNVYEQTKYEGECIVREAIAELPVSVFRPGMVVGDASTGEIDTFNTVYVPLRLYLSGRMRWVPARPDMPLNIVPVDYVAGAITRLSFDKRAEGRTFHLTVAKEHLPGTKELLDMARNWAAEHLGSMPSPARFIPPPAAAGAAAGRLGVPKTLLSYFSEKRSYRRDNVEHLLGSYAPDWRKILPRLFAYAASKGFLPSAGRTVHEQLVHRLQSGRIPVRIHDVGEGATASPRSGTEMCDEIGKAAASLRALGIGRGDRVALLGCNSSRFLSLDTAIGLVGAVSVPLYYTSPSVEIDAILRASGARLLFIGAPKLLARTGEIRTPITMISFCKSPLQGGPAQRMLRWEEFLLMGRAHASGAAAVSSHGRPVSYDAPVGFADLATLRFTSGTTGAPKGVEFCHGQVRWLAETITSLLPWKARTRPVRYLSFLPMNHVVEGIMGMYAPSFLPAPVDIYFLEDFHSLGRVLPKVRPTVFFSVPRFYEKVWKSFSEGTAGRVYLFLPSNGPGGFLRRIARPLVKKALLRRAGIDKCAQLIVGSAPTPEGLLEGFRELGIEICNAYGLTEAPLVTMNRHGANRPGTVGVPLPETTVRIADDGEVLVRGPQVTHGYFGGGPNDGIDDGWFRTGDLGEIDSGGRLAINGRKKEIIITSYGKNILPRKIEALLRRIPGMSEVMVIGDNRPSLSALLWLATESVASSALEAIDRSICRMNGELSHPEQVKRWAILKDRPAIENGELTGNLKLRRRVVLERRSAIVDMLYDRNTCGVPVDAVPKIPGVLHFGESEAA